MNCLSAYLQCRGQPFFNGSQFDSFHNQQPFGYLIRLKTSMTQKVHDIDDP